MIKNEVLDVINKRISLRAYSDQPINCEEENAIVNAAMRAPTAGNQMLYSMIIIRDPKKKALLAELCDKTAISAKSTVFNVICG